AQQPGGVFAVERAHDHGAGDEAELRAADQIEIDVAVLQRAVGAHGVKEAALPAGQNADEGVRRVAGARADDAGGADAVAIRLADHEITEGILADLGDHVAGDAHLAHGDRAVDGVAAGGERKLVEESQAARRRVAVDGLADGVHTADADVNDVAHGMTSHSRRYRGTRYRV